VNCSLPMYASITFPPFSPWPPCTFFSGKEFSPFQSSSLTGIFRLIPPQITPSPKYDSSPPFFPFLFTCSPPSLKKETYPLELHWPARPTSLHDSGNHGPPPPFLSIVASSPLLPPAARSRRRGFPLLQGSARPTPVYGDGPPSLF